VLKDYPVFAGPVVYWMSRDQRAEDNWALLYAQAQAIEMKQPFIVIFCLSQSFLGAGERHYGFMMQGLAEVFRTLQQRDIPFLILKGDPAENVIRFIAKFQAGLLIADFSPLKISRTWKQIVAQKSAIRFIEVDAHNLVPCYLASVKQEFSAYTFRHKYYSKLNTYLNDFRPVVRHPVLYTAIDNFQELGDLWQSSRDQLAESSNAFAVQSGARAAKLQLVNFLRLRLANYARRNDPNAEACSGLSPYLHFGQISAQRIVLEITKRGMDGLEFLEELVIRRELADNFCYYNENYDNPAGFPSWARQTLETHRNDMRGHIYRLEELENARTHDRLWNAAQRQMVTSGRIHGYLRMYWAKKILEWSENATVAMAHAIYLNDKYQLDGRDPNGYTGIAWSIGGVHDRAWGERNIFGKIRYMSYEGCKRKFDIERYIRSIDSL
jgi:deoxyribodipyrimidine photo-lyase